MSAPPPVADASLRARLSAVGDPVALLEGMIAHSPVPYIVFRADGHPLLWNRAYREMFAAEPPAEYNVLRDEVTERLGLGDSIRRAFAGHTVHAPTFYYDPKELQHIAVTAANRVAISCTFFPVFSVTGEVAQVVAAFKDVTAELAAREQAEAGRHQLHGIAQHKQQLAEALRHSQQRLLETLEAADVGTWEWDIEANRVDWSPNIERIFGLPPGGFAGTYEAWVALIHPDDRAFVTRTVATTVEQRGSYEIEFRCIRPDGSIGWQNGRGHVVVEPGRSPLLRGIVFDVSARREAEDRARELADALRLSEARYRSFVAQSSEGIWRCELDAPVPIDLPVDEQIEAFYRDGYMAESNDAMARMYGYESADALQGVRLGSLLVREDPRNTEYLRAFIESGYRLEDAESHEVDRQGARRIFSNSLVGVVDQGRLSRAWGTQRDVTAQAEARAQAEAANSAKDAFLAMLGHELRNPLSPILTALELMKLRAPQQFEKERAVIERQVKHVVRLVDDLLDVSRMTRGNISLQLRSVELADSVATGIELASPLLERLRHQLTVQVPRALTVTGDPTRLSQIFANLLTNAAKYTPAGGHITIAGDVHAGRVRVSVRDTGIGIRPAILPRIFELFVQEAQPIDRSVGGLGLGLAIVRSLVTLHGGSVEARSDGPGLGSQFTVYLPLESESEAAAVEPAVPSTQEPQPAGGRKRILVVDDNEDAAELLAEALAETGHVVDMAHDGPAALQAVASFRPEVVLLDIGLPVMDGYEVARRIRAQPELRGIRLIAVTGYGQAKDQAAAREAGFDHHMVKPVDMAALEHTLASLDDRGEPNA